jgi:anti-sigma28 factor (negative regulator of flagellin synthesis)
VEAIRSAIRNNAYPVDFDLLAKRMVESMAGEKA